MARPLRIEYPGAWYHVMNRGRRREKIFSSQSDYKTFLKILGKTSKLFLIEIHAYVLMPNHYHILLHTPLGNLSRAMRHINGVYTQTYNKKNGIDGSLFKGRYKSIVVEQGSYLLKLVRYIHRNPFKAKLEEELGQYKWCSHVGYMDDEKKEEWLVTKDVLLDFSKYEKESRRQLKAFVQKEVSKDLMKRLSGVNWPAILGGEEFKEKMKKIYMGKEIVTKEVPDFKRKVIDVYYAREEAMNLVEANRVVFNNKRNCLDVIMRRAIIYILRSQYMLKISEISEMIGGITESAVSKHYKIADEDIAKKSNNALKREVKKFVKKLKFNFQT